MVLSRVHTSAEAQQPPFTLIHQYHQGLCMIPLSNVKAFIWQCSRKCENKSWFCPFIRTHSEG